MASLYFAGQVLLLGSIAVLLAGLATWLGGLKLTAPIAALCAAIAGLSCAMLFTSRNTIAVCAFTLVPAAIGCIIKKPLVVLVGGAIAAMAVMVVLSGVSFDEAGMPPLHPMPLEDGRMQSLSAGQTAVEIKSEFLFWTGTVAGVIKGCSIGALIAGAAAGMVFVAAGIVMSRMVAALTCASLGTVLIFAGMVGVLLYKGSRPLSYIYSKPSFFGTVAVAMIIFGTFTQLILCPSNPARRHAKKSENGEE